MNAAAEAGRVRPARRPPGWLPPGPPPAARPEASLGPHAGEDLCYLAGDWRIFQRIAGHRWSLDDLATAWVATQVADRPPDRFVDLGCGIGTVLMLVAWRFPAARGLGIEAQATSVDLARRSLAWNGAAERCEVRRGDFREVVPGLAAAGAHLVTGTPPYLTPGHATVSSRAQCGPCHFEERGGIEAYCDAAAVLLAPGGRFVVCAAAFQHDRTLAAIAAAGLVAERDVTVIPRAGKSPLFRVYVARRAGAPAAASSGGLPDALVVRDTSGRWTEAFAGVRTAMGMPVHAPTTEDGA